MRSKRLFFAMLFSLLAFTLNACHRGESKADESTVAKKVKCAEVMTRQLSDSLELRGVVSPLPNADAQITSSEPGRVLKILVQEGDQVKTGQVVAEMDSALLADQYHQAEAVLAKARAENRNAQTALERVKKVFEVGIAAKQELDDAEAKSASAQAEEAEALASAQHAKRQADATTLRSPMNGVVFRIMRRPGEVVDGNSTTPVMEIGDPSTLEMVADAPAQDIVRIARGDSAKIEFAALPGKIYRGKVSVVSPAIDRVSGLGTIRILLDLEDNAPPPVGAYGIAFIISGHPANVLTVPMIALRNSIAGEAEVVVCGADKKASVRKIKVGKTASDIVEVQGLQPGDNRVAIAPVLGLNDGDVLEAAQ